MRSGICPKCGERTVFRSKEGCSISFGDGDFRVHTGARRISNPYAKQENYICTSCGYFETYISESAVLSRVEESWSPVEADET
jgi:predicted RNA-binding Zn-ribbon protein involved in translation (DUF1610 family)